VSHSTPEAEIVAADYAIRQEGMPALSFWDEIASGHPPMIFNEDNEAMIKVCRSGRNPTMRHLLRAHGVSVAYLKEVFDRPDINLQYVPSARQAADIYTKSFTNGDAWALVTTLIGVYDPANFNIRQNVEFWKHTPKTKAELAIEETWDGAPAPMVSRPSSAGGDSGRFFARFFAIFATNFGTGPGYAGAKGPGGPTRH